MRRRQSKSARSDRRMGARRFIASVFAFVLSIGVAGTFWMSASSVSGQTPAQCADGIDNDGDGQTDALVTGGNPSATLTIGGGNPFVIRTIVNTGGYGIPDNGAIHRDAATVNKVCQIQGYTAASSSDCTAPPYDSRCGWRSFGDNLMFAWNGSSFYSIRDNVWTSTITCVGVPAACADGKDNDGDGKIDTADTGCANASDASEVAHDAGCADAADQFEGPRQCSDGIDNDNDGKADAAGADPGCTDGNDDDEADPAPPPPDRPGFDPPPQPSGNTCAAGDMCGTGSATCPDGKKVEWARDNVVCTMPGNDPRNTGRCYRCVDADGPPPLCPVTCQQDADCGTTLRCKEAQNPDGTSTGAPLCWKDDDSGLCVKKCLVPRCIDNSCQMAPPAEDTPGYPYVPCEGAASCPAPRCGDGVVQAGEEARNPGPDPGATGGGTCNVTGTSCAQITDARACSNGKCVDVNGRDIQGTSCTCPSALSTPVFRPSIVASLIDGSSLLATSIINNCSLSCASGFRCGAGEACFALVNARSVQRQCAPANCSGREAECGMTAYGNMEWQMCPGTEVPSRDPEPDPEDPVGEPTPADGEECDDGNNNSNDGCSPSCKKEECGDGIVQQKGADGLPNTIDDEQCDDGNLAVGDGCSNECVVEACGNGVHDQGEECDDGVDNSDTKPAACRMDCTLPRCNDGVVDVWPQDFGLDEQCDCGPAYADFDWVEANKPGSTLKPYCETVVDGKPALCHVGNCQAFYCGDGFTFNAGLDNESGTEDDEMCDAGPFNSDEPVGGGCVNNVQCPGAVCVAGECTEVNCSSSNECNGGKCIGGTCKPGGCLSDADCSSGRVCADDGSCKRVDNLFTQEGRCIDNNDCPSGYCHPSGSCMAEIAPDQVPDPTCRMDCKPVRCGDGIVDKGAGETCDEGQGMFRCNGYPQPACSCGIPSWGSLTRPMGATFDTTCCPANQFCTLWGSDSCPSTCGVGGVCGDGTVDPGEECDETSGTQTSDGKVAFTWRTNRDGTRAAFTEDDGKWGIVPASEDDIFTAIDHEPEQGAESSDGSWIVTSLTGTARTYFHLWDITSLTSETVFSRIKLRIGVDFSGLGIEWKLIELDMVPIYHPSVSEAVLYGNDMNAAIVEIVADEDAHTLTFTLFHSSTGKPMTKPLVVASPVELAGRTKIAIDAMEIVTSGTSTDQQSTCEKCKILRCGNSVVEESNDEECDDGNAENNDGCTDQCMLEICRLPSAE